MDPDDGWLPQLYDGSRPKLVPHESPEIRVTASQTPPLLERESDYELPWD